MKNFLKAIKAFILVTVKYMIKAYLFVKVYNWFLPVLFNAPIINGAQSIGLVLSVEFLLSDKADHIYSENTSMEMVTVCDITRYLALFLIMYIIKMIMGI